MTKTAASLSMALMLGPMLGACDTVEPLDPRDVHDDIAALGYELSEHERALVDAALAEYDEDPPSPELGHLHPKIAELAERIATDPDDPALVGDAEALALELLEADPSSPSANAFTDRPRPLAANWHCNAAKGLADDARLLAALASSTAAANYSTIGMPYSINCFFETIFTKQAALEAADDAEWAFMTWTARDQAAASVAHAIDTADDAVFYCAASAVAAYDPSEPGQDNLAKTTYSTILESRDFMQLAGFYLNLCTPYF